MQNIFDQMKNEMFPYGMPQAPKRNYFQEALQEKQKAQSTPSTNTQISVYNPKMDSIPTKKVETKKEDYRQNAVAWENTKATRRQELQEGGDFSEKEVKFLKGVKEKGRDKEDALGFLLQKRKEQGIGDKTLRTGGASDYIADAAGGLYKSANSINELMAGRGDKIGYNLIKSIYGKEEADKVAHKLQGSSMSDVVNETLGNIGANQNSGTFKVAKGVGDITQSMAGGEILGAYAGATKAGKYVANIAENGGKFAKTAIGIGKNFVRGATDQALYDGVADHEVNPTNMLLGGGLNAGLGVAGQIAGGVARGVGKQTSKFASWLQMNGISTMSTVKKMAKALGSEADEVGLRAINKGFNGGKETIYKKVADFAEKNHADTIDALSKSKTLHKYKPVNDALNKLKSIFTEGGKAKPGLEQEYREVLKLQIKHNKGGLSLIDMNNVQKLQGEYLPNFTKSLEVADTANAKANANLYTRVKSYIERNGLKEGIGNIKELKKDTQLAHILKKSIGDKLAGDEARQFVNPFNPTFLGGVIGGGANGNPLEDPQGFAVGFAKGALLGQLQQNKYIHTLLAKYLVKAGGVNNVFKNEVVGMLTRIGKRALIPGAVTYINDLLSGQEQTETPKQTK